MGADSPVCGIIEDSRNFVGVEAEVKKGLYNGHRKWTGSLDSDSVHFTCFHVVRLF